MLKKTTHLLILSLAVFMLQVSEVYACPGPPAISAEETKQLLEEAVFVGKVKYRDYNKYDGAKFEIIQSYKGFGFSKVVHVKNFSYFSMCSGPSPPRDLIYEEVILKEDDGSYSTVLGHLDLNVPEWEKLRKKARTTRKLIKEQKACEKEGKGWVSHRLHNRWFVSDCHLPTNDKEKSCTDSNECEDICIWDEHKCSAWKNLEHTK